MFQVFRLEVLLKACRIPVSMRAPYIRTFPVPPIFGLMAELVLLEVRASTKPLSALSTTKLLYSSVDAPMSEQIGLVREGFFATRDIASKGLKVLVCLAVLIVSSLVYELSTARLAPVDIRRHPRERFRQRFALRICVRAMGRVFF